MVLMVVMHCCKTLKYISVDSEHYNENDYQ